jgi:hypothetical protein
MTIEKRKDASDSYNHVATVCEWCGEPLPDNTGYADHLPLCEGSDVSREVTREKYNTATTYSDD